MYRGLPALLFLFCISLCYAQVDFSGTYKCHGYDPYLNAGYMGTIIIKPQNSVYSLKMSYDTGDEAVGTGGLYDLNTIAVVFQDTRDHKKIGLERYSLSKDRQHIEGFWVYLGKDKLGRESCEKVKQETSLGVKS